MPSPKELAIKVSVDYKDLDILTEKIGNIANVLQSKATLNIDVSQFKSALAELQSMAKGIKLPVNLDLKGSMAEGLKGFSTEGLQLKGVNEQLQVEIARLFQIRQLRNQITKEGGDKSNVNKQHAEQLKIIMDLIAKENNLTGISAENYKKIKQSIDQYYNALVKTGNLQGMLSKAQTSQQKPQLGYMWSGVNPFPAFQELGRMILPTGIYTQLSMIGMTFKRMIPDVGKLKEAWQGLGTAGQIGIGGMGIAAIGAVAGIAALVGAFMLLKKGIEEAYTIGKDWIKNFSEAQKASDILKMSLMRVGEYTPKTQREFDGLSKQLATMTGIDDDLIKKHLGVVTALSGSKDAAINVSKAVYGMSRLMGTDASQSAEMIGKALAKPEETLGRLSKLIPDLNKDELKNMSIEQQRAAVIEALNKKFATYADTTDLIGTKISVLENKYGDLKEALGEQLAEGAGRGLDYLTDLIVNIDTGQFESIGNSFSLLVDSTLAFTEALGGADVATVSFVGIITSILDSLTGLVAFYNGNKETLTMIARVMMPGFEAGYEVGTALEEYGRKQIDNLEEQKNAYNRLILEIKGYETSINDVDDAISASDEITDRSIEAANDLIQAYENEQTTSASLAEEKRNVANAIDLLTERQQNGISTTKEQADAIEEAKNKLQEYQNELDSISPESFASRMISGLSSVSTYIQDLVNDARNLKNEISNIDILPSGLPDDDPEVRRKKAEEALRKQSKGKASGSKESSGAGKGGGGGKAETLERKSLYDSFLDVYQNYLKEVSDLTNDNITYEETLAKTRYDKQKSDLDVQLQLGMISKKNYYKQLEELDEQQAFADKRLNDSKLEESTKNQKALKDMLIESEKAAGLERIALLKELQMSEQQIKDIETKQAKGENVTKTEADAVKKYNDLKKKQFETEKDINNRIRQENINQNNVNKQSNDKALEQRRQHIENLKQTYSAEIGLLKGFGDAYGKFFQDLFSQQEGAFKNLAKGMLNTLIDYLELELLGGNIAALIEAVITGGLSATQFGGLMLAGAMLEGLRGAVSGFAVGGVGDTEMLATVFEKNKKEAILPLTNPKAMADIRQAILGTNEPLFRQKNIMPIVSTNVNNIGDSASKTNEISININKPLMIADDKRMLEKTGKTLSKIIKKQERRYV